MEGYKIEKIAFQFHEKMKVEKYFPIVLFFVSLR